MTAVDQDGRHPPGLAFDRFRNAAKFEHVQEEFRRLATHVESKHITTRFLEAMGRLVELGYAEERSGWIWRAE